MPNSLCIIEVNAPVESVWKFVSKIENWAPLVPGYIHHKILSETESTWKFKSDMGIMKKNVHLKVNITSWQEPTKVTFHLAGINEKFTGNGYFAANKLSENKVLMKGCLDINAEGVLAKMVNPILSTSLPEMTKELTEAVAAKIEEVIGVYPET